MTLEAAFALGPFAMHRRRVDSLPTLGVSEHGGFILLEMALFQVRRRVDKGYSKGDTEKGVQWLEPRAVAPRASLLSLWCVERTIQIWAHKAQRWELFAQRPSREVQVRVGHKAVVRGCTRSHRKHLEQRPRWSKSLVTIT